MAEQSSTVVAFRALVMLICLILIPVAAFCGGSFPAVMKAIQSGRWPTLADFRGPAGPPPNPATEAPRFMPTPAAGSLRATDPKTLGFSGPVAGFGPAPRGETAGSPVVSAIYTTPINPHPSMGEPGPVTASFQDNDPGIDPRRRLSPLPPGTGDLLSPDHLATTGHGDAPACRSGSAGGPSCNDQLKYVLGRLQKLGATYFVLDTYGDEAREFRFYCKMSIGGNPHVTKPFWCFDGDPLKAVTQVLKQVEDWQSGGG